MRRWLFTVFCAVSSLVCVTTVALWMRSHFSDDHFHHEFRHLVDHDGANIRTSVEISTSAGELHVSESRSRAQIQELVPYDDLLIYPFPWPEIKDNNPSFLSRLGFEFFRNSSSVEGVIRLSFPLWVLAILSALLPTCWLIWHPRRRQAWRSSRGLCRTCAYDLSHNSSGICPECGTTISHKSAATEIPS
jgi:hypothetical protein